MLQLPYYAPGLGTVTRAWRRHSVTIQRKEGRRETCLIIKAQFLWLKRGRNGLKLFALDQPRASRHPGRPSLLMEYRKEKA